MSLEILESAVAAGGPNSAQPGGGETVCATRSLAVGNELATAAQPVSLPSVENILEQWFGCATRILPIASERDQMFRVTIGDAENILKISHVAEDPAIPNMQVAALDHIAAVDPSIPIPTVVPANDGQRLLRLPVEGHLRSIWMQRALTGVPFASQPSTPAMRGALGKLAARVALALRGFFHPAAGRSIGWDIKHAGDLRPFLEEVDDKGRTAEPLQVLEFFATEIAPKIPALRAQVIHNDLNPHNLLVASADTQLITAVFDFGDMVHSAMVNDLAIAAAYQMSLPVDPLGAAIDVIVGYHAQVPLEDAEVELIFDLIRTRLAMTIAIAEWRAARSPENAAYILKNTGTAWNGLASLAQISRDSALGRIRAACNSTRT